MDFNFDEDLLREEEGMLEEDDDLTMECDYTLMDSKRISQRCPFA